MTHDEEAVRRLLAQARHDAPAPDEVVARLDATLTDLVAARDIACDSTGDDSTETGSLAPVVDLGAARPRRAGLLLFAASVVVLAGVGLSQVNPFAGTPSESSGARDFSATESDKAPSTASEAQPDDATGPPTPQRGTSGTAGRTHTDGVAADDLARLPHLSSTMSDEELLGVLDEAPTAADLPQTWDTAVNTCAQSSAPGKVTPVAWDGEFAWAYLTPLDEGLRVEIQLCDQSTARVVQVN